jgi:hypothetical protein
MMKYLNLGWNSIRSFRHARPSLPGSSAWAENRTLAAGAHRRGRLRPVEKPVSFTTTWAEIHRESMAHPETTILGGRIAYRQIDFRIDELHREGRSRKFVGRPRMP